MNLKWAIAKCLKKLLNPPALNHCNIDPTAKVGPASELTGVEVGRYTYIGSRCFSITSKIGSFCSIADTCRIGGAAHDLSYVSTSPVFFKGKNMLHKNFAQHQQQHAELTVIEHDVWLGAGAQIKSGVTVHTGAIIGMGSVVTHDVPPYEIWAGNPARKIRDRFDEETKEKLLRSRWWELPDDELAAVADKFDDVNQFCDEEMKHEKA